MARGKRLEFILSLFSNAHGAYCFLFSLIGVFSPFSFSPRSIIRVSNVELMKRENNNNNKNKTLQCFECDRPRAGESSSG